MIIWKHGMPRLWPTYIGEGGGFWAKHMGLNRSVIGNTIGEHIWNLWNKLRTWREHVGNKGKMKKKSHTPNLKEKNKADFEWMLNLPIGFMKFLFPKLFITIFGMG
jgi:hypothetical protein